MKVVVFFILIISCIGATAQNKMFGNGGWNLNGKFMYFVNGSDTLFKIMPDSIVSLKKVRSGAHKNNAAKDSTLTTDNNGNVILELREGYKIYTAVLTSVAGGTDPSTLVLRNTVGSIVWARNGVGDYTAVLSGAFPANKVWITVSNESTTTLSLGKSVNFKRATNNTLAGGAFTYANVATDDWEVYIEIRVYP